MSSTDSVQTIVVRNLELLSEAARISIDDLIESCDAFLNDHRAMSRSLDTLLAPSFAKIPETIREGISLNAKRFLVAFEVLKEKGKSYKVEDVISIDLHSIMVLLQFSIAGAKVAPPVHAVTGGNIKDIASTVTNIILESCKATPVIWKGISLVNSQNGGVSYGQARLGNSTPDCSKLMFLMMLYSFTGSNTRSAVQYLSGRLGDLSGADSPVEFIGTAMNNFELLKKVNKEGVFFPGHVTTICGNTNINACMMKGAATSYGACCGKSLPMGLALIPTGPFCMSHALSDSSASSVALHAILTLSLLNMFSIVYSARAESRIEISDPQFVTNAPQGFEALGDENDLRALGKSYDRMSDAVASASARISRALGAIFDGVTVESLNTLIIPNGGARSGAKATAQHKTFPKFIQESIAARSWYLRMLNLINFTEPEYNSKNFSRQNIVSQVFSASVLLSMHLNYNPGNDSVAADITKLAADVFPQKIRDNDSITSINEVLGKMRDDDFISSIMSNGHVVSSGIRDPVAKLEASFSTQVVKTTTTGKIDPHNAVVFIHGPVLFGTGYAAGKATKAISEGRTNAEFFQTPRQEIECVRSLISDRHATKESTKATGKRAAASKMAGSSAPRPQNTTTVMQTVGDDDYNDITSSKAKASSTTPSREGLRDSHRVSRPAVHSGGFDQFDHKRSQKALPDTDDDEPVQAPKRKHAESDDDVPAPKRKPAKPVKPDSDDDVPAPKRKPAKPDSDDDVPVQAPKRKHAEPVKPDSDDDVPVQAPKRKPAKPDSDDDEEVVQAPKPKRKPAKPESDEDAPVDSDL